MTASIWTWIGATSDPTTASNWRLASGLGNSDGLPQSDDTAIFNGGTAVPPDFDASVLSGLALDLTGNAAIDFTNHTFSAAASGIDALSTINATGTATTLSIVGYFTNSGLIEVTGSNASLSIPISVGLGGLINQGTIAVSKGDQLATNVGVTDNGVVTVNGGTAVISSIAIGTTLGSVGSLTVEGAGASVTVNSGMDVGVLGSGAVTIGSGGLVSAAGGLFLAESGTLSRGMVTVDTGGTLIVGPITVGGPGNGTLSVQGGLVQTTGTDASIGIGSFEGGNGLLIINGGTISDPGPFQVGNNNGSGSLVVSGGGTLLTTASFLNVSVDASGTGQAAAVVSGGTWDTSGLVIGNAGIRSNGTGSLDINSNGLVLVTGVVDVGGNPGGVGVLTVENDGTLNTGGGLAVGAPFSGIANGTVTVGDGGTVESGGLTVSGDGTVIVGGTAHSALLTDSGVLTIGQSDTGAALIVNPFGTVTEIGTSELSITGTSSAVTVNGGTLTGVSGVQIGGLDSAGTLVVENGGLLVSDSSSQGVSVGANDLFGSVGTGSGTLIVNGGTLQDAGNDFTIGGTNTTGTLLVEGGGLLTTTDAIFDATGTGQAGGTVSGAIWNLTGGLIVGGGSGSLDINSNGLVNAGTNTIEIGSFSPSSGTVTAESGGTLIGGALSVANNFSGDDTGLLSVGAGAAVEASSISEGGGGTIVVDQGVRTSNGDTGGIAIGSNGAGAVLTIDTGGVVSETGTQSFVDSFDIGYSGASVDSGTVSINGGTLLAAGGVSVSNGTLNVLAGGQVTSEGTPSLYMNALDTSKALVNVSGGTWASNGQIIIGDNGSGSVDINSGGLVNAGTNSVVLGNQSFGSGTLSLESGGSLLAGQLVLNNDTALVATGLLSVAGGTIKVSSLGENANSTLDVSSGSLAVSGVAAIGQSGTDAALTVSGGHVSTGTMTVATSSGTSGTLTISGGIVNVASLSTGTGSQIVLAGGTLSSSGGATNRGLVSGFGSFASTLTNSGSIVASGLLDVTGSISGTGAITITGGATFEVDGALGNSQAITFGTSANAADLLLGAPQTSSSFAINNWQNGDEIVFTNGVTVSGDQWFGGAGTLAVFTTDGTYNFTNVTLAAGAFPVFATGTNFVELVSCFTIGTLVCTTRGEVAVEHLVAGDMVPTGIDGTELPILWIGHRDVDCARHPKPRTVWPVRIGVGAFGPGLPVHDLMLSPDHAVYVNEVLVPVKHLINDTTIVQVPVDRVTYYHVQLSRHDVLFAEGLPTESYLDVGDRFNFENGGGQIALHPEFSAHRWDTARIWEALGCARLIVTGPELAAARARVTIASVRHAA